MFYYRIHWTLKVIHDPSRFQLLLPPFPFLRLPILIQRSGIVTGLPATSDCTWGLGRQTATCLRRLRWMLAGSGG